MRKLVLLSAFVLLISSTSSAQGFYGVANGDFETWTGSTPDSWTIAGGAINKASSSYLGSFAAEVQNTTGAAGKLTQSWPFTKRTPRARFNYKFKSGTAGDKFRVQILLSRWNTSTSSRDIIAAIDFQSTFPNSSLQTLDYPFAYFNTTLNPDSAWIIVESSINTGYSVNTSLIVDNFALQALAGVSETATSGLDVKAYPNPAKENTVISYTISKNSNVSIKIFDITGKEVMIVLNEKKEAGNYNTSIDVSNLKAGIYYYQVNIDGVSKTAKLTITK